MTIPAIPEPSALEVEHVAALGRELLAWAESTDDVAAVRDAANRWSAIAEYARRTSREGVAEAEATMRRLEVRITALTERAPVGRPPKETPRAPGIDDRHERDYLNTIRDHADVVEDVIRNSDDASPPSRRKVLGEIKRRQDEAEIADEVEAAERLAPRIHKAIEAMADAPPLPDWVVTLRFHCIHIDDLRMVLPDEAEVVSINEEGS